MGKEIFYTFTVHDENDCGVKEEIITFVIDLLESFCLVVEVDLVQDFYNNHLCSLVANNQISVKVV